MKKYITVAALLAAGTAFANADVVAVFNCGHSDNTGWMTSHDDWKPATLGNYYGNINVSAGEDGISLSLSGDTLVGTGAGGSFTANNNTAAGGPYAIPPALTTLSSGVFGKNTYDTLWGGSVNMWNAGSATLKLGDLKANTKYTVYLFSARANGSTSGSVEWESSSTPDVSWSVWTLGDSGAAEKNDSSTVWFDGSTTGKNASIVEVTFTTGAEQTEVAFSTSSSQRFTLNGIVVDQGSTIPEPSAFGLLAGLGALALVASRRRRK